MLSWYAVASAIDTARAGNPRLTPMAAISAAFSPCSVVSSTRCAASCAEQPSGSGSGPDPRHSATPDADHDREHDEEDQGPQFISVGCRAVSWRAAPR